MHRLGSPSNPLRVAIVGSGPSGFYAAEALLQSDLTIHVDMLERLPAPFGLVRSGVAPDHPKLKQPIQIFDAIAQSDRFSFLGNVKVGQDVTVDELRHSHHAIVFACGAESERRLDIPGEDLPGSHTATEFVGWYNGHPDYRNRTFDLSQESVAIIGNGNVAVDVARILAKPVRELAQTDIAQHALDALAESRVREIHLIGRRGPAQAKFTNKELRELGELTECAVEVSEADLELNAASIAELNDKKNFVAAKNVEIFRSWTTRRAAGADKRIVFHFLRSPVALTGTSRVQRLTLARNELSGEPFNQHANPTEACMDVDCGLVFRSIGYRGVPVPGLPFDARSGVLPNDGGRVQGIAGVYATGWIKRGPSGIIGTNRACAVATIATLIADVSGFTAEPKPGAAGLLPLLSRRATRAVTYQDWQRIDAEEIRRGTACSKPREKMTSVEEMLALLGS